MTTTGLCATLLPTTGDLWFSTDPADRDEARQVCSRCPLFFACTTAGLAVPGTRGVWGALDAGDRAHYRGEPAGLNADDEDLPPVRRRPACGTEGGYLSHAQRSETCEVCQAAHSVRLAAERRVRLEAEHAMGGSVNGTALHRRLGEAVCEQCRAAAARDQADRKARGLAEGARAWAAASPPTSFRAAA